MSTQPNPPAQPPTQPPIDILVALEPRINSTLAQGHQVTAVLAAFGYTHPRLYGISVPGPHNPPLVIPETADEGRAEFENAPNGVTLQAMHLPADFKCCLVFVSDQNADKFGNEAPEHYVADAWYTLNNPASPDPISALEQFYLRVKSDMGPAPNSVESVAVSFPGIRHQVRNALNALTK